MIFILGVLVGLVLSCFVAILFQRFQIPIQRNISQVMNSPILFNSREGYIAGLSEEESNFVATLPIDKQVKIL